MAFAKPLVLDYGGAATKSLPLINQDGYGTEYYLREATQDFRVKIRHSREAKKADGRVVERHNVEMTRTVFGTSGDPDTVQQVYLVLRNDSRDVASDVAKIGEALSKLMVLARFEDLVAWLN